MKPKKHLLILPKWYPNERDVQLGIFIQNHAVLLADQYEVSIVYVRSKPQKETFLVTNTINNGVNEIYVTFKKSTYLSKPIHLIRYLKAQKLGFLALQNKVNLCHVHVPIRPTFLANYLFNHLHIPFCVTEHWSGHLNGDYNQKSFLYKWWYKQSIKKAFAITTVSNKLQEAFLDNTGLESQVIPNYIQSTNIQSIEKKSGLNIVTVSDLNNSTKNITGLLKGFKLALEKKSQLHLTIIGDGPDRSLIEEEIKELSLSSFVSLKGRFEHNAVLTALPSFQFYICNSNVETFGMTVAEAILAGLPVICTKCGGPESFLSSENAMLIEVNNNQMLGSAIVSMSEHYLDYNTKNNQANIISMFGKQAIAKKWSALYNTILPE